MHKKKVAPRTRSKPSKSNITELKQAEAALRESEERLNRAQEIAHLGSWELNVASNVLKWSDEVYRIFGLRPQEFDVTYETFLESVHPDDRAAVDAAYSSSLREGRDTYEIEHRIVRKTTGEIRFVHEKCEHIHDASGKIIRSVGMVHDVTERRMLEEELDKYTKQLEITVEERTMELREAHRQFEAFFNYSITPLVFLDREFNFIRVNEAYAIACKRDVSEFAGRNHFELFPNEENETIFRRVVETKIPYQAVAKPFSFPDHTEWGVTYWDWTLTPVLDREGEVDFLVFSLKDVTERKRAENELLMSEERYRSLIQQAADGIAVLDKWLDIIEANPAVCEISGYNLEELTGLNVKTLIPTGDLIVKPLALDRLFAGEIVREERRFFHKNGSLIDVEVSSKQLQDGNIQVIVRDITKRKETEKRERFIASLLDLFVRKESKREYLDAVVQLIQELTHCRCIGIRLVNDQGYIPYESYTGFSTEFWKLENMLSLNKDICACVRIINRQVEPQDKSVLTPDGSFYINNSLKFIKRLSEKELARFRGNCIKTGFLSIAIIPINYRSKPIGLIHLADERQEMVPFKIIQSLESVAPLIGEAILRFDSEEELRNSREQLRGLFANLQSAREQEKKQIAQELHDEFGSILTGLKVDLSWLKQKIPEEEALLKEKMEGDLDLVSSAIKKVQRISSELRPLVLDHLGLTAAMEWQLKQFANRSGIQWDISIDTESTNFDMDFSIAVFRIFQEVLTNIIRHAEATKINVDMKERDGYLILDIIDNGKGIPEEKLSDHNSFGLMGMKERTQYLGGDLEIKGIINKGTTVTLKIPMKTKD